MKYLKICFISILLLSSNTIYAYKPDTGHAVIASVAFERFSECVRESPLYEIKEWKKRLLKGNVSMDKGFGFRLKDRYKLKGERVLDLPARITNWHFFNSMRAHLSRIDKVEQSLVRLWEGLEKGFELNHESYDKLLFIGGLMHLIEDMTVPAHVIPIYHGPALVKFLGPKKLKPLVAYAQDARDDFGLMIPDKFDTFEVDIVSLQNSLDEDKKFCERLRSKSRQLVEIRATVAAATLSALNQPINNCPGFTWHAFYRKPAESEYFGRYNLAWPKIYGTGLNPLFSEPGVLVLENGSSCAFEKSDSRYSTFANRLHENAVSGGTEVLFWAHSMLVSEE